VDELEMLWVRRVCLATDGVMFWGLQALSLAVALLSAVHAPFTSMALQSDPVSFPWV